MKHKFDENKVDEMSESLADVFTSISKHEGEHIAAFVHALVSMKNISDGLRIMSGGALSAADDDEELKERVTLMHSHMQHLIFASISKFYEATQGSFAIEKALEWAEKIDGQLERGAAGIIKK